MTAEQVAEAIKKRHTINAPPMNWIAGHALIHEEMLALLEKAKNGLESDKPLARNSVRREIDNYLKEWNR